MIQLKTIILSVLLLSQVLSLYNSCNIPEENYRQEIGYGKLMDFHGRNYFSLKPSQNEPKENFVLSFEIQKTKIDLHGKLFGREETEEHSQNIQFRYYNDNMEVKLWESPEDGGTLYLMFVDYKKKDFYQEYMRFSLYMDHNKVQMYMNGILQQEIYADEGVIINFEKMIDHNYYFQYNEMYMRNFEYGVDLSEEQVECLTGQSSKCRSHIGEVLVNDKACVKQQCIDNAHTLKDISIAGDVKIEQTYGHPMNIYLQTEYNQIPDCISGYVMDVTGSIQQLTHDTDINNPSVNIDYVSFRDHCKDTQKCTFYYVLTVEEVFVLKYELDIVLNDYYKNYSVQSNVSFDKLRSQLDEEQEVDENGVTWVERKMQLLPAVQFYIQLYEDAEFQIEQKPRPFQTQKMKYRAGSPIYAQVRIYENTRQKELYDSWGFQIQVQEATLGGKECQILKQAETEDGFINLTLYPNRFVQDVTEKLNVELKLVDKKQLRQQQVELEKVQDNEQVEQIFTQGERIVRKFLNQLMN